MSLRYGNERIKRGLLHFVFGKALAALAGIAAIALVIRGLSVEDFAAYSILVAFVEVFTVISGLGLTQVLLRYVPELYEKHYQESLRKLVLVAIVLRSSMLIITVLGAYFFADNISQFVGLNQFTHVFQVFLLCVILRTTVHFLSLILESTLHQGIVQVGFLFATLFRLIGMVYLLNNGNVKLIEVIWVEVIGEGLSLLVMALAVIRVIWQNDTSYLSTPEDSTWLKKNFKQISKFAVAGYLQHFTITPYGGHTNRLVGGNMLNVSAMASYGFAQTFYEYIKRYMPAQLLIGLIRPVVISRYCVARDFSAASSICEQVLQINLLLIGGLFTLLFAGGSEAIIMISAGKYGLASLYILAALFVVLIFETQRQQLELLLQTVERQEFLVASNLLLSMSVILAIVFVPLLGPVAFAIANIFGLLIANAWVKRELVNLGYRYTHDWQTILKLFIVVLLVIAFAQLLKFFGLHWQLVAFLAMCLYSCVTWWLFGNILSRFVFDLLGAKVKQI